jgi:penicillin-binding protein 2
MEAALFQRRLKWFAIGMTLLAIVIVGRLFQIQVLQAAQYESVADKMLTREVQYIRAPRGEILDRHGRLLVSDMPAWDISIKYDVIAGRSEYLYALANRMQRDGRQPRARDDQEIVQDLRLDIAQMWHRLADLTGESIADFAERGDTVVEQVGRIRENVFRRSGIMRPVKEESAFHPIVASVDDDLALRVRLELEDKYPWLAVVPGSRRVAHDADALVHVLGRIGAVSRERIAADPRGEDDLRALRAGDQCGVSGIEFVADPILRGTRGQIVEDFSRVEIARTEPTRGESVRLTIDADLQAAALAALEEAVHNIKPVEGSNDVCGSTGGSAVVIDVNTREVLALVSYPIYSYESYRRDYAALAADRRWMPLRFRAVSEQYPPGSTCKVATAVGGLTEGVVTPDTRVHCRGYFLESQPKAFRCWIYNSYAGLTHDAANPLGQNVQDALRYSCNIYFFTVGEKLGPSLLCEWFRRVGLGRTQGTGLREEASGIVPDSEYLQAAQNRGFLPSDAWNFAIGQGEVTATPIQAANVAATIASGYWAPVRMLRTGSAAPAEATGVKLAEPVLHEVRAGMWRVVNEDGGTAYKFARLKEDPNNVLCGKTGSAQAVSRVISRDYTFAWPDGRREVVRAGNEDEAEQELRRQFPDAFNRNPVVVGDVNTAAKPARLIGSRVAERYPPWQPDDKLPSHAWFIGWTQSAGTKRGDPPQGHVYAIAVVVEYGSHGGSEAGPVAKRIAESLLSREID